MIADHDRCSDQGASQRRGVVRSSTEERPLTNRGFGTDGYAIHGVAVDVITECRERSHLQVPWGPDEAGWGNSTPRTNLGAEKPQERSAPAVQRPTGSRSESHQPNSFPDQPTEQGGFRNLVLVFERGEVHGHSCQLRDSCSAR